MTMSSTAQLRKQIKKPMIERRRRERINDCLQQLKAIILDFESKEPSRYSKMEKADILEMTVKHVKEMHLFNYKRHPHQTPLSTASRAVDYHHQHSAASEVTSVTSSSPRSSPDSFLSQSPLRMLNGPALSEVPDIGVKDPRRCYKDGFKEGGLETRPFTSAICRRDLSSEVRECDDPSRHLDRSMDSFSAAELNNSLKQSNSAEVHVNSCSVACRISDSEVAVYPIRNVDYRVSPSVLKQLKLESSDTECDVRCQNSRPFCGKEEASSNQTSSESQIRDSNTSPRESVFLNSGLSYSTVSPNSFTLSHMSMSPQEYSRQTSICPSSGCSVPPHSIIGYGSVKPIHSPLSVSCARYVLSPAFVPACIRPFEIDFNNNNVSGRSNSDNIDKNYLSESRAQQKYEPITSQNFNVEHEGKVLCQRPGFSDPLCFSVVRPPLHEEFCTRGDSSLTRAMPSWRPWERF